MNRQINMFYWIAALSVVNSLCLLIIGKSTLIFGMAFTRYMDIFAIDQAQKVSPQAAMIIRIITISPDVLFAGLFFLFGYLGHRKNQKAVIAGIVLYALDAVIWLIYKDWLVNLFHIWMLVLLIPAAVSISKWKKLQASQLQNQPPATQIGESDSPADTSDSLTDEQILLAKKMMPLESRIKTAIDSFTAIGIFSLLYTLLYGTKQNAVLIVGLGITRFIDAFLGRGLSYWNIGSGVFAFVLDLIISVVWILLGKKAKEREKSVLRAGLIMYALDSLIYLFTKTWSSLLFHLFFLYLIWSGYRALCEWEKIEDDTLAKILIPAREMVNKAAAAEKKELPPLVQKILNIFVISILVIFVVILPVTIFILRYLPR